MNKETFSRIVADMLPDLLPEAYKDVKIEITKQFGINVDSEALCFKKEGLLVVPTMSIDDIYGIYESKGDMGEALSEIAKFVTEALDDNKLYSDLDQARKLIDENVVLRLINTESNKAMLENVPHRETNDCSVYYRIMYADDSGKMMSTVVTNAIAESAGYSEQELFDRAVENTKRLYPPQIKSMTEIMSESMNLSAEEMEELGFVSAGYTDQMIIISNTAGCYGAVYMLFDECLQEAAKRVGDNIYVLPSSLHEVIAVPEKDTLSVGQLSTMVEEINQFQVDPKDRLSNQVYHYDKDAREFTMVSDGINRSVTELVAEKSISYDKKVPVR